MANWWETDPVADAMPKADEWWSNDPVVGATKPPPPKDRGWGEAAADFGVGVAKGVVGMAKLVPMAVGAADTVISKAFSLGDPVTGGALANPATRALDDAQKYLQTKKSDYIQGKEAQADSSSKAFGQKFEDVAVIGGVPVGKIAAETVASFGQYMSDPSLLVQGVSENLASIIPSGLAARGTQAAAESLIPKIATSLTEQTVSRLARTAGVAGGISTGAVQQGSDVASEAYGKVMELSDEIWQQNPRYVELAAQVGDKKAKDQIAGEIATEAGVKSGIQSLVVNAVGAKFGGATLESAFLKPVKATDAAGKAVAGSSLKGFAKGGLGEAVTEAPEEGYGALVTNQAVAQIDPTVDIYQGVGSAAGKGAATAFGMGSVAGAREGMAAGLISRQRAQAEGALKQATDAGSAAAAANELAGSVDSLTMDVDAYLGRAVQGPASAVNVEQELGQVLPTPLGAPAQTEAGRIAELRGVADRNAELMGQADAAGTAFDRRMALEQAEVSLGEAAPLGPRYADLTPMNERQASTRLAVMRDMAANEGGNALELAVVPHPGQAGMFAIGRQAVPSLDTQPGAPAPLAAGEAQARIEAADLVGKQAERRAEDAPRLAMVDRAKANIEARGGVASPYEAEVLRQANAGRPYDRIDPSLGRAASTDEKLSAATGIAVGSEAGLGNRPRSSETVQPPAAPFQYDRTTQGRRRETSTPPVIDTVSSFVGAMRRENTPAAQAFVREYEAGRITDADVQTALQVQQRGAQTPSQIIEQAANQAPRPQGGLQVEQSSAPRAITPTLAEAVTLYGGKPYTQSDLTAEGSTSRLSTAASIAPNTATDGVQVAQGLAPRNEFAGRQATVTSANKALPPRPQRIQNQPTGQLTDAQLEQIASNDALPAISRRGASIELEARRLQQQARGGAARRDADQADVQGRLEAAAAEGGRLAQPTGGRIITSGAKLSTQRQPVPGSKGSVNDQGTGHEYTVVDASRLGATGRLLQQIARIFGKRLVVFTSETLKADGFVLDGDNRTIYINANAQMSPLAVFGHELTHLIKRDNPRAYAAIQAVVERELGEGAMQQFEQEYGAGANLEELTSDLVGNRFQEASFWRDVFLEISAQQAEGAKSVIARLANSMNRAINAFLKIVQQPGFQADQYVKDLNAIKSAVKSAMVDYAQGQRGEAIALDQAGDGSSEYDSGAIEGAQNAKFSVAGRDQGLSSDARQDRRPAGQDGGGEIPVYGQAREGSVSVVGRHYSPEQRNTLSGLYYGRGLKGAERSRLDNSPDPRLRQRVYFYVDNGNGIRPESGVGAHAHEVRLDNVYDPASGLIAPQGNPNAFESAVLNAGFDGYLMRNFTNTQGAVVLLGPKHRVVPVAAIGRPAAAAVAQPAAPATLKKGLLSRELNALDASRIPGAQVRNGNLEISEDQRDAANAELERIGSSARFSRQRAIDTASLEEAFKLATSQTWRRGRDLKMALQQRALDTSIAAGLDVTQDSDSTRDYLQDVGVKDALIALKQNANAIGWYDRKTRQALAVMALVHPEIMRDENARFAFTWALAVTSNGLKVGKNFELAEGVYEVYKRTGRMPTNIGIGTAGGQINDALELFNELRTAWGIDDLRKFMQTRFTVSEITGISKNLTPSGEHADVTVKGAAIIGPKIGNGFFSNLYGDFSSLTMDRWLIRTWGRWTGTLIKAMPEQTEKASRRLRSALDAILDDRVEAQRLGGLISLPLDADTDVNDLARAVQEASQIKATRDKINESEVGLELRKAGNSLAKYLDGQKEAPAGPEERKYIRAVFGDILSDLRKTPGYEQLTMADLQAVLWYAEKRLYETAKEDPADEDVEGYADDDAPDYANAAAEVARSKGVSDRRINTTLKRIENERSGRTRDAAVEGAEVGRAAGTGEQGPAEGFARQEKQRFIGERAVLRARADRARNAQSSGAYQGEGRGDGERLRVLRKLGVTYVDRWKADPRTRTIFRANSLPTPEFVELAPTADNAQRFQETISANKAAQKHGAAVYVYPAEDYAGMRLFLADDGKAGVAIKPDGDIVSVFSAPGSVYGRAVMELAVAAGGRKLDAFDTILPEFYAPHGFRAVARTRWDDAFSPDDWSKELFSRFNNGEPDVVFMAYDPAKMDAEYRTRDGRVMSGEGAYDRAVAAQTREVRRVSRSSRSAPPPLIDGDTTEDDAPTATPSRQRNVEDISRDELAGRRVKMDVLVEDTGETATMTLDAKDALDDVDERESVMQRLLGCLRK